MIVNQITEEVRRMQANDGYLQKYLAADVAKFEGAVICNVCIYFASMKHE